jgi:chaperonin cofactor prefoldin
MSIESWVAVAVGIITIVTSIGVFIRWLVKHYFDEMRAELKPNSGSSMKDQVTRLEAKTEKLETKIDDLYDKLIIYLSNNNK